MTERVIDLTLELLRIPSVYGHEQALCDHVEALLATASHLQLQRYRHSLVARGPRRKGHQQLLLAGHLDTVPDRQTGPVRVEGDEVFGCGASDMKGGVAVILDLLLDATTRGTDIVGVLYEKEEGPYLDSGLGPVFDAETFDEVTLALCLEPTDGIVHHGCVGTLHATVTIEGTRAHSARPWHGDNALHKSAGFIADVAAFGVRDVDVEGLCFREVMNITTARAGEARNVIPDKAEFNLNYRYAPGRDPASARQVVLDLVGNRWSVEFVDDAPSAPVCRDNPLLRRLHEAGVGEAPKQAWTDVARFAALGIDAANYGPGATRWAHQVDERASLSAIVEARARLGALVS